MLRGRVVLEWRAMSIVCKKTRHYDGIVNLQANPERLLLFANRNNFQLERTHLFAKREVVIFVIFTQWQAVIAIQIY